MASESPKSSADIKLTRECDRKRQRSEGDQLDASLSKRVFLSAILESSGSGNKSSDETTIFGNEKDISYLNRSGVGEESKKTYSTISSVFNEYSYEASSIASSTESSPDEVDTESASTNHDEIELEYSEYGQSRSEHSDLTVNKIDCAQSQISSHEKCVYSPRMTKSFAQKASSSHKMITTNSHSWVKLGSNSLDLHESTASDRLSMQGENFEDEETKELDVQSQSLFHADSYMRTDLHENVGSSLVRRSDTTKIDIASGSCDFEDSKSIVKGDNDIPPCYALPSCSTRLNDGSAVRNNKERTVEPSYVLSSGRLSLEEEARLGRRPPTIDSEFEEYFSALML